MEQQQNNEEMAMYQVCPYINDCSGYNYYTPNESVFRDDDDDSRHQGCYGSKSYGCYGFPYGFEQPYWYGHGWGHHGWGHHGWEGHHDHHGHHGWHREIDENQRHDQCSKPMTTPCPMEMPMQPIQPIIQPTEKNFKEFKILENNVNITEINNTIIEIEQKHPYMMKKLLMLGLAHEECKKIIYLALLCSGKFNL